MQHFTIHAFLIECLTNLHVGSGDNNYGVVDKQVQRDSISHVPIINASSLKGALREYFEEALGWKKTEPEKLARLFGSDKGSDDTTDESGEQPAGTTQTPVEKKPRVFRQGDLRIFEARLLSIPVRGTNPAGKAFYRATSKDLIQNVNSLVRAFDKNQPAFLPEPVAGQLVETEFNRYPLLQGSGLDKWVGEDAIVLQHGELNSHVLEHLPIIARNSLDNGQSTNLWYEEVVPRESRFLFFVAAPDSKDSGSPATDSGKDFIRGIVNQTVQIGANATVGYGYCKISQPHVKA